MSSENIKKIYVLNLDKTRLTIILGFLIMGLGGSFLLGLKFKTPDLTVPAKESYKSFDIPESNTALVNDISQTTENDKILALPEEDTQIFTRSESPNEDPFLADPPSRVKKAPQTAVHEKDKSHISTKTVQKAKSMTSPKANESKSTFYTVQIGAFEHEKDAIALSRDLRKKGIDARVDKGTLYYFVRTGKASTKDSLEPVYQKLTNKMKIKAIIIQKKIS